MSQKWPEVSPRTRGAFVNRKSLELAEHYPRIQLEESIDDCVALHALLYSEGGLR